MEKKIVFTANAPAPIGPYSQAVQAGGLLFVSGQIAADAGGLPVGEETRQVMQNVGHVLAAAGLSYAHIVKTSIFLKNMDDLRPLMKPTARFSAKIFRPAKP